MWNNYQSLSVETRSLERTRELVEQPRQSLEVVQGQLPLRGRQHDRAAQRPDCFHASAEDQYHPRPRQLADSPGDWRRASVASSK